MTFDVIAAAGGLGKLGAAAGGLGQSDAAAAPASSMVTPGILGFLVFAALAVALVFLIKSMNKQLRKITPEPGPTAASSTEDPAKQETPK